MFEQAASAIKLRLRSATDRQDKRRYCYRVAAQDLVVDIHIHGLDGFEQSCPSIFEVDIQRNLVGTADEAQQLYQGKGWIGNEWRDVMCWADFSGYQINVSGVGTFWIADDGDDIVLIEEEQGAGIELVFETMLGPALILALAKHDIWCWHASAVLVGGGVIAFMGESGKGKSTLARWLDARFDESWRRIGDDILPLAMGDGGVDVLPHFPQLKIPAEEQPSAGLPERLPLAAVYVVDRPAEGDGVEIQPLGKQEGTLALVRHTVASRLFDGDLLAKQLDFCVQTASQVPVRKLIYPLTANALPVVQEALLNDVQSMSVSSGSLA